MGERAWNLDNVASQAGRVALVTGANAGLGFETARMLAARGAAGILACRSESKGAQTIGRIRKIHPDAMVTMLSLDLADLGSVREAAQAVLNSHSRLDLLINNAGVMVPPFSRTSQGFELQFGTNHLGHFALTGRLMPLILSTPASRVVIVSSAAANFGNIDLGDLNFERRAYSKWGGYNQSKLATLIFSLELARRLSVAGASTIAAAAHPGGAATDLQRNAWYFRWFVNPFFSASASSGALPTMRAATDPTVTNGSYWGPSGPFEMRGPPTRVDPPRRARNRDVAERLWAASEELTDVRFGFGPGGA